MPQQDDIITDSIVNTPLDPRISYGGMDNTPKYVPPAEPTGPNRATYDAAVGQNTGFIHDPGQLGWDETATKRFSDAGINKLPTWFNKDTIYSDAFRLGGRDPVQNYIDLHNTPIDQAAGQWNAASRASQSLFGSTGVDPNAEGDPAKEAYLRTAFGQMNNAKDSWWDRNKGWAIPGMGFATIASMGALAPVTAGATAGAEVAGGMTAAEASALAGESAAGYGAGGAAGLGAAGAGGGGLGTIEAGAMLGESGAGYGGSGIAEAIAGGQAAGADVGMGAGTSWLTDLGLPASYGNDLGALLSYGGDKLINLDWGALAKSGLDLGKLVGGGAMPGGVAGSTTSGGGGTTSAPQTSQIIPGGPISSSKPAAPATMPTGSIMGAFGNKAEKPDYQKYFSTLF
jgi:hypothetical protein